MTTKKRKKKKGFKSKQQKSTTSNKLILIDLGLVFDLSLKDSLFEETLLKKCLIKMIERTNVFLDVSFEFEKEKNPFFKEHFKNNQYKNYTPELLYNTITQMFRAHPSGHLFYKLSRAEKDHQTYRRLIDRNRDRDYIKSKEEFLKVVKAASEIMKGSIESTLLLNPKLNQRIYEFKKKKLYNNLPVRRMFRLTLDQEYRDILKIIFSYYTKNWKDETKTLKNIELISIEEIEQLIRVITSRKYLLIHPESKNPFYEFSLPLLISKTLF